MKIRMNLLMTVLAVSLLSIAVAAARETFRVNWHGTAYTKNANGTITARPYSQREIVARIAANNGLDPRTLALVYVHDEDEPAEELEVVPANNGAVTTANVYQFLGGQSVGNDAGTVFVRQRFIYDEDHGGALGTISGTERLRRNATGQIIAFSYRGRFEMHIPEDGTVIVGTFATGRRVP